MSLRDMTGWLLLAAALGFGVLAFFLMRGYLSSQEDQMRLSLRQGREGTTKVIVAKQPLTSGDVISPATVAIGEMPNDHVPGRALFPRDFKNVNNKVLNRPMAAGETLQGDFVAGLVVDRFSDLLQKGQRAVSLEVASLQNVSGMLLPGDYVDLFVMLKPKNGGDQKRLEPVLQRVKVLAAGPQPLHTHDQSFQRLPDQDSKYSQITLGVSLADAERLVVARDTGDMVYLLRNANDTQRVAGLQGSFGSDDSGAYWYNSGALPEGERRSLPRPSSQTAWFSGPSQPAGNIDQPSGNPDNTITVGGSYAGP